MVLIITGCIQVDKSVPVVAVRNANDRIQQYEKTLAWAINSGVFNKIIFAENSNYDFDYSEFEELAKNRGIQFEYLTFLGDIESIKKKGKGFGEGQIIKYALENSKIVSLDDTYFCKITGRLLVSNISEIIAPNYHKYNFIIQNKPQICQLDTRLYCSNIEFFKKNLLNEYKKVDDNNDYYLEHVYYDAVHSIKKAKMRCFYKRPLFQGVAGSSGYEYQDTRKSFDAIFDILGKFNLYNSEFIWKFLMPIKKIKDGKNE